MEPTDLLNILLAIVVIEFIINKTLSFLNYSWFKKSPDKRINNLFSKEEYSKSIEYKRANFKIGLFASVVSFISILLLLICDGFGVLDTYIRSHFTNELLIMLLFFGALGIASELISLPFSLYQTFVIEEKFGFNNTKISTFVSDKIKSYALVIILGGGVLTIIFLLYSWMGSDFWWVAWLIISFISLLMNLFYAKFIVPLFNKQVPLEDGSLKNQLYAYVKKVGFALENVFVIDGSKRSSKANAYFSGFGKEKRITLYDTLLTKLTEAEIVAVMAHEVGHYKKNHIIYNLIINVISTGILFFIFALVIDNPLLTEALGGRKISFHLGLISFGLLYSPVSTVIGLLMNTLSRRFEFQADEYAAKTNEPQALIDSLIKLSKDSLSNLTPHPWYVWFNYSHPPLIERINALERLLKKS